MTLLDHVVLQVDDLTTIGDWYDQIVSLAGGRRTFDMPNLIGYAYPASRPNCSSPRRPTRRSPDPPRPQGRGRGDRPARLRVATATGAEILHEPRLWPEYGPDYYAVFIRDPAGNNLELNCQASTHTN